MVGPLLSLDGHRAAIVIGNEDEVRGALCCPVQDMRHWLCREFLNFGDAKSSQYSPHNFPLGGCLQITTMMICHGHLLAALAIVLSIERSAAAGSHSSWRRPSCNLFGKNSLLADNTRCASSITRDALSLPLQLRGGSTKADDADINDDDEDEEERRKIQQQKQEEFEKLSKYRTEQQILYQLRSTYLSEMLALRGVPLPTITSVSTADGDKPPEKVDWDCAMCTEHDPKSCLYSFDAEPNTKVVAPLGTDQWISLSALNRLRRTDPTKVEPMWHSRYSILKSWFSDESEFSMLQHVGVKGFLVSSVLLDGGNGLVLRSLLIMTVLTVIITLMPLLEFIVGRIIVSAPFWAQWTTWGRIVRAGFPLKLLLGQLAWKGVATAFSKLESNVREYIVDMECEILEESVPLTVGVDSIDEADGESDVEEVVDNLDGEDFDSYDDYDDEDDY
jgi:hypothetical protein